MIAMTGRVTMLGLSRWTENGGSYRTVQRFFYAVIPWAQVFWAFFREHLLDEQDMYLLAGDECVVSKAGKKTHDLDYLFSSLRQKVVPGLSFFTLALISTKQRRSYPVCVEQMIRTERRESRQPGKKVTSLGAQKLLLHSKNLYLPRSCQYNLSFISAISQKYIERKFY